MSRAIRPIACAAAWLLLGASALAAPEDDHRKGVQAYARGDVVGAMSALSAPAKAGHAPSQTFLAFIRDRADFVDEAFELYRAAAAQDDPDGHAGLANAYLTGRGIAKDEKLALQHFSKAAELGHPLSIEVVANAHMKGQMGLASAPPAQTVAALRRAADKGHLPSIEGLAQAYRTGRWELPVDVAQATALQARAQALRSQRASAASAPKATP